MNAKDSKKQRMRFRMRMRYYEPCSRFMEGGSLYGRSRRSPYIAGRICRIFRTCIRLNFSSDNRWFLTGSNATAYNNQKMHLLFAYQFRPARVRLTPRPPRKAMPVEAETEMVWQKAA